MQRNTSQTCSAARVGYAESAEQLERGFDARLGRTLEPFERARIAAPREDVEHRRREIDASHFRLALRTQNHALIPQTQRASRRRSACATGALIGGIKRNLLRHQMIDRSLGIEAEH